MNEDVEGIQIAAVELKCILVKAKYLSNLILPSLGKTSYLIKFQFVG